MYFASTYCLPAFVLAVFFFLLVLFAPRSGREKAFKVATSLFIAVLVVSGILFVAGLVLFLGFVLAPQVSLFLLAFLPSSATALLLARLLKRESISPEAPVRIEALPFVDAIGFTVILAILVACAVYAFLVTKPQVVLPNLEAVRRAVALDSSGSLPESFLAYVRTTEEFRVEVSKEEQGYFSSKRKPFMYTNAEGKQVLISSTQELKEFAPEMYKERIEDYVLRKLTTPTREFYMPERLKTELLRYRKEERVVYAEKNAEAIQPLLSKFAILGLPSDLSSIQVADSLIRFAPQDSYRVEEVAGFVREYAECKTRKYFFIFSLCMYRAADGTIYRIVEESS